MSGEVADGFHCHGFHTAKTLRENVIDNIEEGLRKSGRQRSDFSITAPVMAVMGDTPQEIDAMRERVRGMIGFYGATSYYKSMFAAHNWDDTFNRLLEKLYSFFQSSVVASRPEIAALQIEIVSLHILSWLF